MEQNNDLIWMPEPTNELLAERLEHAEERIAALESRLEYLLDFLGLFA